MHHKTLVTSQQHYPSALYPAQLPWGSMHAVIVVAGAHHSRHSPGLLPCNPHPCSLLIHSSCDHVPHTHTHTHPAPAVPHTSRSLITLPAFCCFDRSARRLRQRHQPHKTTAITAHTASA